MIRRAVPGDETALEAHLARHSAGSMFLRGNLAAYGLGHADHPHATTYHLFPARGPIRAVLGLTRSGMVLSQCAEAPEAIPVFAAALAGQVVSGFSGEAAPTGALIAALGFDPARDFRMHHVEPLFRLDLAALPEGEAHLRPPQPDEREMLAGWFAAYMAETGLGAGDPALGIAEAQDRARAAVAPGSSVRLLLRDGRPVAMAALNARAGASVQVGGVYVPPGCRNRGLGRAVTRALLAEARAGGAAEAILFADNEAAARAYRSIGFAQVGEYCIGFLHGPCRAGGQE